MSDHPDELDLDAVRTGEAPPDVVTHVAGCGECTARLREIEAVAAMLHGMREMDAAPVRESTDRQIRWIAQKEALRVRRTRPLGVTLRYAAAVAAVLVLAIGTVGVVQTMTSPRLARGDANADGTVDILDAYTVALKGSPLALDGADADGSGTVDEADAAQIARWAVSLSRS